MVFIGTFNPEDSPAEDCRNDNTNGFVFLLCTGAGALVAISFVTKATTGREGEGRVLQSNFPVAALQQLP